LNLPWLCQRPFSGTFSGTLLNLIWLCTKASQTFSGIFGTFPGTSLTNPSRDELFFVDYPTALCNSYANYATAKR
jgi:hypothetical protein